MVTSRRGDVRIERPGTAQPAPVSQGHSVHIGDVVRTHTGGACQIALTDESFINLGEDSAFRVNQYSFDETENRRTAVVQVLAGTARVVIFRKRSGGSRFRVETDVAEIDPDGIADFVVSLKPEGTEALVLQKGLHIRNRSALYVGGFRLGENQKTIVKKAHPPSRPENISQEERRKLLNALKNL